MGYCDTTLSHIEFQSYRSVVSVAVCHILYHRGGGKTEASWLTEKHLMSIFSNANGNQWEQLASLMLDIGSIMSVRTSKVIGSWTIWCMPDVWVLNGS